MQVLASTVWLQFSYKAAQGKGFELLGFGFAGFGVSGTRSFWVRGVEGERYSQCFWAVFGSTLPASHGAEINFYIGGWRFGQSFGQDPGTSLGLRGEFAEGESM